jgi:hypothetical protein
MHSVLARLVLVFAFIPGIDPDADADALVLDDNAMEPSLALERRLGRQLKNCALPLLHGTATAEGELVVNVRLEPDGSIHVVNVQSGNRAMDEGAERKLNGAPA